MADAKALNLTHSIGLVIDKDAKVTATQWDGPAFKAGIVSGARWAYFCVLRGLPAVAAVARRAMRTWSTTGRR